MSRPVRACLSCGTTATNAIYLGHRWHWHDGRPRYVLTCRDHVKKVVEYQASIGITAQVHEISDVEVIGSCCAAWRSHACGLPEDHEGKHLCWPNCGDSPTADDKVYDPFTGSRCAQVGGVRRGEPE